MRLGPHRPEHGAATAELAVALPALVLVLALALAALDVGIAQVRCVDAARIGARLLARGDAPGRALAEVRAAAPRGAQVGVEMTGERVGVTVTAALPGLLEPLAGLLEPRATAVARLEVPP